MAEVVYAQGNLTSDQAGQIAATGAAFVGVFFLLWIIMMFVMLAVGIAGTIFWIFMIVDCAKREFKNDNDKVVWIILLALTHLLGATIYYFAVKKQDKKGK